MINNKYHIILLILCFSCAMQFDYLFNGASRYVPLRVSIVIFLILLFKCNHYRYIKVALSYILLLASVFFVFWWEQLSLELINRTLSNLLIIFLPYAIVSICLENLNYIKKMRMFNVFIIFCTISVIIETVFRILYPTLALNNLSDSHYINSIVNRYNFIDVLNHGYAFYAYKYSSIMFYDSNYTGLFVLFIFVLALFSYHCNKNKVMQVIILIDILLVLLSYSRSAVICLMMILCIFIIYKIYQKIDCRYYALIILCFIFIIVFVLIKMGVNVSISDGSLITKINIFKDFFEQYGKDSNLEHILFGIGFIDGGYLYSYKEGSYAHALIPLLFGEIGFFGFLLYFSILVVNIRKLGIYGVYVFFAIIVAGLSLVDPYQVVYIVGITFMVFLKKDIKPCKLNV